MIYIFKTKFICVHIQSKNWLYRIHDTAIIIFWTYILKNMSFWSVRQVDIHSIFIIGHSIIRYILMYRNFTPYAGFLPCYLMNSMMLLTAGIQGSQNISLEYRGTWTWFLFIKKSLFLIYIYTCKRTNGHSNASEIRIIFYKLLTLIIMFQST